MTKACLYSGQVFHKRFSPKQHELTYSVFSMFVDLDELKELSASRKYFSLNRFNLVSFYEGDYGNPVRPAHISLKNHLLGLLGENGINANLVDRIKVLAYPRLFGFVFNPITVYFCYGEGDEHIAIIYEVRNTFAERHNYIFEVPLGSSFAAPHNADKCFHVSPFFDRQGTYYFSLTEPGDLIAISINYKKGDEPRLKACFKGVRQDFSDQNLLSCALKTPFMTLKVIGGILFEALRLKAKGLKVFRHPEKHVYQSSQAKLNIKKQEVQKDPS